MNDILYEQSKMNNSFEIYNLKEYIKQLIIPARLDFYDDNEEINDAIFRIMNCIRRTIIDEVEVIAFDSIEIDTGVSKGTLAVYNNEYIAQRIHCIPILYNNIKDVKITSIEFDFNNKSDDWAIMTPSNSTTNTANYFDAEIYNNLPILYIPPHSSFKCTANLNRMKGMSAKYAHAWYDADGKFFVESIGRTENTPNDAYNAFVTAVNTLINNIESMSKCINADNKSDNVSRYNREFIFVDSSRSVMNLVVTLFRLQMSINIIKEENTSDHMYMFSVVQPHMSISDVYKLLVNIKKKDVDFMNALLQSAVHNNQKTYPDDPCKLMVQYMFDYAILFLNELLHSYNLPINL